LVDFLVYNKYRKINRADIEIIVALYATIISVAIVIAIYIIYCLYMGKKCIPGMFCIENMTLFFIVLFIILAIYFYHRFSSLEQKINRNTSPLFIQPLMPPPTMSNLVNTLNDPYYPPLKNDGAFGLPINIESRPSMRTDYSQIGILTSEKNNHLILPLMGRRSYQRDKWQYYTISNTGAVNTKLPIKKDGKNCTSEYGCNEIYDKDKVHVTGYDEIFYATIYENAMFSYIPI
jgi:hypothetical protein